MPKEISDQSTSLITARTPLENYPVASLFITHGELAGREIPLTRDTFFIGRSRTNNLVFNDKSVSRKHAVINSLEGEFIISDIDSLKGIFVNGKKIKETSLHPGDVINIGENRMQFRMLSPSGTWAMPGGLRWVKYLIITLILGVLIGGGVWFGTQKYYYKSELPKETMAQLQEHYNRGIELFNKEHNVEGAREEWKKILELDPEKKTDYAIKAATLLKSSEVK